ncbi:Mediator of RNA polymerase II transcription subunit [Lachnellula hyalina]|uniref:Mediator of RNA polymerase II transcription subunit 5 n=1 Tax=Lachnellula hyalina TaxID=1316788 RepID=A0A8H8R5K5_9HELO|nr:Mediator of RNA polymerase II transcription subunit [Lachnellula hyalina]TVY27259.1 Mediator of RNA polymerase II transcription subunit [Lachnellula hyalina]
MFAPASWQTFLDHSLATRLDPETFECYVQILSSKQPLPPSPISDIFLRPTETNTSSLDPRIPRYVQILLSLELVTVPSLLRALLRYSSSKIVQEQDNESQEGEKKKVQRWSNSTASEETLFYRLARTISSAAAPRTMQEAVELIRVCIQWMETELAASNVAQGMLEPGRTEEMNAHTMALGTLVVAAVENAQVINVLGKASAPKGMGKELSKTLGVFVPLLLHMSPQSAARLELFRTQTLVAVEPVDKKDAEANKEIDELLDEGMGIDSMVVVELPSMNSRAGLYVYLNSLLVARPLIDDTAIFQYLHNRYQGDIQQTIIDLILASFDLLANATFRNERVQATTILRSFLINKIPLLLTSLSSSLFPPLTSEYCITEALSHVDTNAFPTLSNMFDESSTNNMFSDSVRQDFCFSCCLHGLIAESSIETLLGDIPMQSLPAGGRYVKEDLVQQCLSDPERAEGLIDELEHMDGNVGAVSQAITEVIGRLCTNKETMSLKGLCSQLARKPSSLDVMLLFDKATTILQPICDLLDNWRYDDDQGEYQPVYEEFGSILLLVLSFTHRYNLSTVDLGIRATDSFVAKLLNQGHLSRAMDDLTEQEQNILDGWIKGLFDNESGGLGDELMSSCPPQDFYLHVPTLFHHIVLACSTKNLSDEGLKGGLEYLVDTFLLPSLIPGITWLSTHLWESRGDANAVLQILSALITNPASISNNTEASQMLNSILNIIAKNLEHSLRWFQRAEPSRQDVEPLSRALRGNLGWERRGASEHTELEIWTSTQGGGLSMAIKQTIQSLVQWGLNPGININPANYTHRLILVSLKILGAKRLLSTIIGEVKSQTETGNGSVVIDVAAALICAPEAGSWDNAGLDGMGQPLQRRLNLREALKNEAENAPRVSKTDAVHAENVVRLYRKVEAQLVMPMRQQTLMPHDALGDLDQALDSGALDVDGAMANVGLGGDGLGNGLGDGLGGENDLMSGLMGDGHSGGLLDSFGTGGDMGDGMGF